MKNTKGIIAYILIVIMVLTLCACSEETTSTNNVSYKVTEPDYVPSVGTYDSYDVAVIADVKESTGKVTFYNCELKKLYTLELTGASRIADKYGTAMSLAQIKPGDLVEVWFLKDKKTVASMNLATNGFTEPELTNFSVNTWAKTFTIGSDSFRISDATYVVSEGKQISLEELNPSDSVTIRGVGNTIFSVVVDQGHGYLSLSGEDYFLGGFIEVGTKAIYQISSKMIMMVPEGVYSVRITNKGTEAIKEVDIKRGQETTLDLSDVKIQETKNQSFTLVVKPTTAEIYIDGKAIDKTLPVICSYGMHKLIASAEGYKTLTKYFNVDANTREVSVVLVEVASEDVSSSDVSTSDVSSSDVSGNTSGTSTSTSGSTSTSTSTSASGSDSTSTTTSGSGSDSTSVSGSTSTSDSTSGSTDESDTKVFYITIPTPKDVEIYWDGNYMGLAPLSIKKVAGTHVITLRKNGYETRSFTVTIDNTEENVSYSFDDLVPKSE